MIKRMKKNRGQMKIQEMAFVLVAVVFLGGLLLLFFARFQLTSTQRIATELRELRTVTMLRVISSMPELSCAGEINCIDYDKLKFFDASPEIRGKYAELWQSSSITKIVVEEAYPKTTVTKAYKIYDKSAQAAQNIVTYSTFVPLCTQTQQKPTCKIARIKVTAIVP